MRLRKVADKTGPEPAEGEAWPLSHIEVLDAPDRQGFSPDYLTSVIMDGTVTIADGQITFNSKPKVAYRILRAPGHYCSHCDAQLGGEADAKRHVAELHQGEESPDLENPAGYRVDNYFACERVN